MTYFVYSLMDPRDPDVARYIGITSNPVDRLRRHIASSVSNYPKGTRKENWIGNLESIGVRVTMDVFKTVDSIDEAFALEESMIQTLDSLGADLKNGTGGGRGFDPSWTNKTGKSLEELWSDPDWVESRVEIFREYWSKAENREAQSARVSAYMADPASRVRISQALKKYYDENPAEKWSDERKLSFKSSEGYLRMVEDKQDPEYKKRMRIKAEKQFADPNARKEASSHAKRGWDSLTPEQRRVRILKGRLGTNLSWAKKHGRVLSLTPKTCTCKESA